MFRRLAIQSLEDRFLLAAAPDLPAFVALNTPAILSIDLRLGDQSSLATIDSGETQETRASRLAVTVTRALSQPQLSEQIAQANFGRILAIAENIERLRPRVEEALSSTLSPEARRELLALTDEVLDLAIERINAGAARDAVQERVATDALLPSPFIDLPPAIMETIRAEVRDRLEARQSTIATALRESLERAMQSVVQTEGESSQFIRESTAIDPTHKHAVELTANTTEVIPSDNSNDSKGLAPSRNDLLGAQYPNLRETADSPLPKVNEKFATPHYVLPVRWSTDALDAAFAEYKVNEPASAHPSDVDAAFLFGNLVGRVSSLDLLSALDATTSEMLKTVDEIRPRNDLRVVSCITALALGYILRVRSRKPRNVEGGFDAEEATLKIAYGT